MSCSSAPYRRSRSTGSPVVCTLCETHWATENGTYPSGSVATEVPSFCSTDVPLEVPCWMVWNTQAGRAVALKPSSWAQNFRVPEPACGTYRSIRWVPVGWVTPTSNGQYVTPPSETSAQFLYRFVRLAVVNALVVVSWVATVVTGPLIPLTTPPVAGPIAPVTASSANGMKVRAPAVLEVGPLDERAMSMQPTGATGLRAGEAVVAELMDSRSPTWPAPEPFGRCSRQVTAGSVALAPLMYSMLVVWEPETGSTALNEQSSLVPRSTEYWFMTSWMVSEPVATSWQVGSASAGPEVMTTPKPARPMVSAPALTRVTSLDLSLIEMPLH